MSTPPPPPAPRSPAQRDEGEPPPPFDQHLDRLRDARRQADEAVRLLGSGHKNAGGALEQTWQFLFDYLAQKQDENLGLDDLNTAAGIIYKLSQGASQLKSLEQKTRDYEEKFAEKMNAALSRVPGLTPELRAQIEHELHLLS